MTDVVTYDVVPRAGVIDLGKQVEGLVTRVVLPNIRRGKGAVQLVHQRADDQKPYLVPITEDGDRVYWIVNRLDTAYPGRGQAELQWLGVNGEVAKSVTYQTNTTRSMAEPGAVPDEPLKPYTQAVAKDAQAAKDAAARATEAAQSAEASAAQAGISADNAAKSLQELEDGIASGDFRGEKGEKGDRGDVGATGPQGPRGEAGPAGDTTAANAAAEAARKAAQEAQNAAQTAVRYTEQNLTDSQQEQARSNINAADKARQNVLVGTETGNPIAVDDAFAAPLCGLTVYGKSTQDGTPTPDNPVPIVSVGDGGTILVTVGDGADGQQTIALQTPNGLRGIPVASGGNYTDQSGQQWVCDEVDLERTVYIKRVAVTFLTVDMIQSLSSNPSDYCIMIKPPTDYKYAINIRIVLISNRFRYEEKLKGKGVIFGYGNQIRLYVDPNEIKTLDAAKEFIEKNQIEIMYEVNEHVETPLTHAELAAYKAITACAPDTVAQASDGAGLKLEYQRDINIAIKKLEDAIASMTAT